MNDRAIQPESVQGTQFTTIPAGYHGPSTEIHTDTISGAAWLRKYEHPPCDTPSEYCGIPDYNNTPSVHPEYRTIGQIKTFSVSTATPPVTTYYDKVLVLHTSSAVAPVFYWQTAVDGTTYASPNAIINSNIDIKDWVTHNASGRIAYKSATISLNATDFSNQGVVTTASFRPNIRQENVGNLITQFVALGRHVDLELIYRSHRLPEMSSFPVDVAGWRAAFGDAEAYTVLIAGVGVLPLSGTEVAMLSPNAVSDVAKQGCFVVQRFSQPFPQYKSFNLGNRESTGISTQTGCQCYVEVVLDDGTVTLVTVTVANQPGNATTVLQDVAWSDLTWSFTLFEGLSVGPTGAGSNAVPPYLTVKTITGFEMQPLSGSATSPYMHNSAMVDEAALRIASMNNHARLDSLPAAMNFWGSLGKILLQAAPTVISTVSSLFGKKMSAKSEKTARSTASMLTSKIEQLESKLGKVAINAPAPAKPMIPLSQRFTPKPLNPLAKPFVPRARSRSRSKSRSRSVSKARTSRSRSRRR